MFNAKEDLVGKYLHEVIDKGKVHLLDELFAPGCIIHRSELPEPIVGLDNFRAFMTMLLGFVDKMETKVHDIVVSGNMMVSRHTHRLTFRSGVEYPTPTGLVSAGGKTVEWAAMGMCRIENGKVAGEWVQKDDLAILRQLGYFTAPPNS